MASKLDDLLQQRLNKVRKDHLDTLQSLGVPMGSGEDYVAWASQATGDSKEKVRADIMAAKEKKMARGERTVAEQTRHMIGRMDTLKSGPLKGYNDTVKKKLASDAKAEGKNLEAEANKEERLAVMLEREAEMD